MFSPPDYVSLAELWKEFFQKFRLPLTHIAFEKYGDDDFALGDRYGSPDDFCEDAFLSSFTQLQISAAKPDAQVMRRETVLDGGRSKLFQKMSTLESYIAASNPDEAGPENYWLRKLGSDDFEPWDTSTQTIADWRAKYVDSDTELPSQPCFHTLPFVFERGRYVIPDEAPPWLSDVLDEHFLPDVIERFGGRSLCLDLQTAQEWRNTVIRRSTVLKRLEGNAGLGPKLGRPSKQETIRKAYTRRYPKGHNVSLKEVRKEIAADTGQEFSVKTLSRVIKDVNSERDKKPEK